MSDAMKCDDIVESMLRGRVLSDEMKHHIERCEECTLLKKSIESLDAIGGEERLDDISARAVVTVLNTARELQSGGKSAPHARMVDWWLLRGLAAAALFVVIAGGGIMVLGRLLIDAVDEKPVVAVAELHFSSTELDELRTGISKGLAGFGLSYTDAAENGGIGGDLERIRKRISMFSTSLEYEFYGIN